MSFPIQLLPDTPEFLTLRERLTYQVPISKVLALSEGACSTAEKLLPNSLFTEQWRNHKYWVKVGLDSQSPALPSQQEIIRVLNELAISRERPLCKRVLKKSLRPLFTNYGSRDPMSLVPRSHAISLGSPLARHPKLTPSSEGTRWLTRARNSAQPQDSQENFFHHFLTALGLLIAHPFCDGNGRLSRALMNVSAYTPSGKAFPWSIFFLLRNGNYLYNVLPYFREKKLTDCILLSAKQAVIDAERKLIQLRKIQQHFPEFTNHPIEIREQFHWKESFLFS